MIVLNETIQAHTIFLPSGKDFCKFYSSKKGSVCLKCYAKKGHFPRPTVRNAHLRNLETYLSASSSEKIDYISSYINFNKIKYFRNFSSGDFQSIQDIKDWTQIALKCPNTKFWISTRAWNNKRTLPSLITLSKLKNVCVRLSSNLIDDLDFPDSVRSTESFTFASVYKDQSSPASKGLLCGKTVKNSCKKLNCRECWNKECTLVSYKQH